jgi:hypothetical protein
MGLKTQGFKKSPIWLIGDSDPKNWTPPDLEFVFDDRHPTIHNIWTSIIYNEKGKIIDDEQFFIKNAIENSSMNPSQDDHSWNNCLLNRQQSFRHLRHRKWPGQENNSLSVSV